MSQRAISLGKEPEPLVLAAPMPPCVWCQNPGTVYDEGAVCCAACAASENRPRRMIMCALDGELHERYMEFRMSQNQLTDWLSWST